MMPAAVHALSYSAAAIEAWVVDAQTGAPIEGVNVVAHWQLAYGFEGGRGYEMKVMETTTDRDGRFAFQAWGPLVIPEGLPPEARLKKADPEIVMFKPGYDLTYRTGREDRRTPGDFGGPGPATREWFANGDRVRLVKLDQLSEAVRAYRGLANKDTAQVQAATLAFLDRRLESISAHPPCGWRAMPRTIAAEAKAWRALAAGTAAGREALPHEGPLGERLVAADGRPGASCGVSARELLGAAQ